jgi:hypothetical protein
MGGSGGREAGPDASVDVAGTGSGITAAIDDFDVDGGTIESTGPLRHFIGSRSSMLALCCPCCLDQIGEKKGEH